MKDLLWIIPALAIGLAAVGIAADRLSPGAAIADKMDEFSEQTGRTIKELMRRRDDAIERHAK